MYCVERATPLLAHSQLLAARISHVPRVPHGHSPISRHPDGPISVSGIEPDQTSGITRQIEGWHRWL